MSAPTLLSYLSPGEALAICKLAQPKKQPNRALEAARAVAVPLLGLTGGIVAGFAGGLAFDKIHQHLMHSPVPVPYLRAVAPALGSIAGLAWGLSKAYELEDLRRAIQGHPDSPPRTR